MDKVHVHGLVTNPTLNKHTLLTNFWAKSILSHTIYFTQLVDILSIFLMSVQPSKYLTKMAILVPTGQI